MASTTELPGREWRWVVPVVALSLAALVLLTDSNRALFAALNGWSRFTGESLWAHLTVLGGGAITAACALPFVGRRADVVWATLLLAAACYASVELCKTALPFDRPPAVLPADELLVIGPALRKNAFPSGHTTTAFALAGLLALTVVHGRLRVALLALAVLVGLSRVVVGVHWPLDVLAGAALGWTLAVVAVAVARRWTWGQGEPVQLVLALLLLVSTVRLVGDPGRHAATADFQRGLGALALVLAAPGCWRVVVRWPATRRARQQAAAGPG